MKPRPAQYLLRFDDLCPAMDRVRWQRFGLMIREFGICPILAVVPNNKDPDLEITEPNPAFWGQMREMEAAGAKIGLHGYRHLSGGRGRSLLPLHRETEFAGVRLEVQREWIRSGLEILRGHGLNPRIWVAPRHGFDRNTLAVLREEGIGLLSDGFARLPFVRGGLTWIPQQLWAPVEKSNGLWTICLHSNTATESLVRQVEDFLRHHAAEFTSVERVLAEAAPTRLSASEWLYGMAMLLRIQTSRRRKRLFARG